MTDEDEELEQREFQCELFNIEYNRLQGFIDQVSHDQFLDVELYESIYRFIDVHQFPEEDGYEVHDEITREVIFPTKESVLDALKEKINIKKRELIESSHLGQIVRDIYLAQEREREREVVAVDQVPRQEEDQQARQEEAPAQEHNEVMSVSSGTYCTFDTQ